MSGELEDPGAVKEAMREVIGEVSADEIRDAVEQAAQYANEAFARAESDPPEGASMPEWHLQPIIDSLEIRRVEGETEGELAQGTAWVAEWTDENTVFIENGTRPHEIEGNPLLIFRDWRTGDIVSKHKVNHPGIPAVGAIRQGFQRVLEERYA